MTTQLLLRASRRLVAATTSSSASLLAGTRSRLNVATTPSNSFASSARFFSTQPLVEDEFEVEEKLHESESFLSGTSSLYAESMYEMYQQDPNSVHKSWRQYFDNLQNGVAYVESEYDKPTAAKSTSRMAAVAMSGVRRISGPKP
jgi:2-oxoglutarate dehydrogenase E1 component